MNQKSPLRLVLAAVLAVLLIGSIVFFALRGGSDAGTAGPSSNLNPGQTVRTISITGGSHLNNVLTNPEIAKFLADKGWAVTFKGTSSYALATAPSDTVKGQDAVWFASASAQSLFTARHPDMKALGTTTPFKSPMVLYSGPEATEALVKARVVTKSGNAYVVNNLPGLIDLASKRASWSSLGVKNFGGPVKIFTTNPKSSNVGMGMALLELTVLSTRDAFTAPSEAQAKLGLPHVKVLLDAQGTMSEASDSGFAGWWSNGGETSQGLYAGYEQQLVSFLNTNPGQADTVKKYVTVLYPQPTWANDHPYSALTDNGMAFMNEVLKDPAFAQLVWKNTGWRDASSPMASKVSDIAGLPLLQQPQYSNAPNAAVTSLLLTCVNAGACS